MRTLFAVLLLLSACSDPRDQAAKARIFSPEDPSPALLRAAEPLDVVEAQQTPALWARLWTMDRLEATHRLGGHRSNSRVVFEWERGSKRVSLEEKTRFETDTAGAFRIVHENDQEAGLEFVWTGDRAFARSRFGPFRERRIDRAQHEFWRDQASALATLYELGDRRLRPGLPSAVEVSGRRALRFPLVVGEPWGQAPPPRDLPPVEYPKARDGEGALVSGPDEGTALRLAFEDHRELRSAEGFVSIDLETGVVLEASFLGRFVVREAGAAGAQEGATLQVRADFSLQPADDVKVSVPDEIASPRIARSLRDPLGFLGEVEAPAPAKEEEGEP